MFSKIYNYFTLLYNLKKYYDYYQEEKICNEQLLDNVLKKVTDCGAVMIKFTQWITPKLELIYYEENDITSFDDGQLEWLKKMERFYENCENHDLNYT